MEKNLIISVGVVMVFVDQQAAVIVLLVRKLIDNFFDLKKEQQANIIVEEKL